MENAAFKISEMPTSLSIEGEAHWLLFWDICSFSPTLRVFKWNDIRDYGIHILVLFSLSRLWSTEVVQKNWLQVLLQGLKTRKFKHVMRSYVFIQAEQFKEDVPFCLYVFEFTPYMKLVSTLLFWCNLAKHNCKLLIQDEKNVSSVVCQCN